MSVLHFSPLTQGRGFYLPFLISSKEVELAPICMCHFQATITQSILIPGIPSSKRVNVVKLGSCACQVRVRTQTEFRKPGNVFTPSRPIFIYRSLDILGSTTRCQQILERDGLFRVQDSGCLFLFSFCFNVFSKCSTKEKKRYHLNSRKKYN